MMLKGQLVISFIAICCISNSIQQDLVKEIWAQTSVCNGCGESGINRAPISIKVCGNIECCWTNYLDGSFNEGSVDIWTEVELGECRNFDVGSLGLPGTITMSVGLYHSGNDEAQFDWVRVTTDQNHQYECTLDPFFLDEDDYVQSNTCTMRF